MKIGWHFHNIPVVASVFLALIAQGWAQATYDLNRKIQPMAPHGNGVASGQDLYQRALKLSGIVPGLPEVAMISNRVVEKEGISIGYPLASVAWSNASLNAGTTYHVQPWIDNGGWISRTLPDGEGGWSAYTYHLQNELWFRPATSVWYTSPTGVKARIARVLVGSLGDWCLPLSGESVPLGYHLGPSWTNRHHGYLKNESITRKPDLKTYYKVIPEVYWSVNDEDGDRDGIPGFADGFNLDGIAGNADDRSSGDRLLPWRISIPTGVDPSCVEIHLNYTASPPWEASTWLNSNNPTSAPTGIFRLWRIDSAGNRTYIPPGIHQPQQLGITASTPFVDVFIEAIFSSINAATISFQVRKGSSLACNYYVYEDANGIYDAIKVSVLKVELVPDWNHDRVIDGTDEGLASPTNPFRIWINDDNDSGDISEEFSDIPGIDLYSSGFYLPDFYTAGVDGRSDLLDYFPIWMNLKQALKVFPPDDNFEYRLRNVDSAVNVVYTDLTRGQAGSFLVTEENTYGVSCNEPAYIADTFVVFDTGIAIDKDFLRKIESDENKGVLMLEGRRASQSDLVLEIVKNGIKVFEKQLSLGVDGVEKMFRHVNMADNLDVPENQHISNADRKNIPTNYPDNLCNGKNFVFIHGFNVDQNSARAWHSEIYKRLYKAGSRAMFTGITWHGDPDNNYHKAVINAMVTSRNLSSELAFLVGDITIGAHSLGNMVVSEAIAKHGFRPEQYFLFNAAVAIQAYDAEQLHGHNGVIMQDAMCHPEWIRYDSRLWASKWHKLFPGDSRQHLTWENRYASIKSQVKVINCYSLGDDVVQNADGTVPDLIGDVWLDQGRLSWVMQEMIKGRRGPLGVYAYELVMPDQHGGWEYNTHWSEGNAHNWDKLEPEDTIGISTEQLREQPFFRRFIAAGDGEAARFLNYDGSVLHAPLGDDAANHQARLPETQYKILAEAIPALSFAAAANEVESFNRINDGRNIEMQELQNEWPKNRRVTDWLHSDFKNVAFNYVYKLYDRIVKEGVLK